MLKYNLESISNENKQGITSKTSYRFDTPIVSCKTLKYKEQGKEGGGRKKKD